MAKIEMAIKDAIARGARKHVRSAAMPLRRDVRRLRQAVRDLRAQLAAIARRDATVERVRKGASPDLLWDAVQRAHERSAAR